MGNLCSSGDERPQHNRPSSALSFGQNQEEPGRPSPWSEIPGQPIELHSMPSRSQPPKRPKRKSNTSSFIAEPPERPTRKKDTPSFVAERPERPSRKEGTAPFEAEPADAPGITIPPTSLARVPLNADLQSLSRPSTARDKGIQRPRTPHGDRPVRHFSTPHGERPPRPPPIPHSDRPVDRPRTPRGERSASRPRTTYRDRSASRPRTPHGERSASRPRTPHGDRPPPIPRPADRERPVQRPSRADHVRFADRPEPALTNPSSSNLSIPIALDQDINTRMPPIPQPSAPQSRLSAATVDTDFLDLYDEAGGDNPTLGRNDASPGEAGPSAQNPSWRRGHRRPRDQ